MMNCYLITREYFYRGKRIKRERWHGLRESDEVKEEVKVIENILDIIKNEGSFPFDTFHTFFRKKYYFTVFDGQYWHYPIDNKSPLTIKTTYEMDDISMEQLMTMQSEKVIKYLKDRGIATCPMMGN